MAKRHPKRQFLEEAGALHRHPEWVRAEPFKRVGSTYSNQVVTE